MSDLNMDKRVMKAFEGEFTPKFLATADPAGTPNIVPVISLMPWDPATLIFAELMIWKTKKNLETNGKVGVSVLTADMNAWTLKGVFEGFERTGPWFDKLSMTDMFRYNAYTGPRNAGGIHVEEVARVRGMIAPPRVAELAFASLAAVGVKNRPEGIMPPQVTEKFSRMKAAKFVSILDPDGFPLALPALSLFPADNGTLEFGAGALRAFGAEPPAPPFKAAAAVITFDPVAYQVKGTVTEYAHRLGVRIARLRVEEVYSASPPLPGKRIDRRPA